MEEREVDAGRDMTSLRWLFVVLFTPSVTVSRGRFRRQGVVTVTSLRLQQIRRQKESRGKRARQQGNPAKGRWGLTVATSTRYTATRVGEKGALGPANDSVASLEGGGEGGGSEQRFAPQRKAEHQQGKYGGETAE